MASRLAVLIAAEGSLSPADLASSCAGLAELSFVADRAESATEHGDDSMLLQVAAGLAPTGLADFADPADCLAAVRQAGADAVTTFVERLCPLAAWLNLQLGADGGNQVPWGRKDLHRQALVQAGLSRIRSLPLERPEQLTEFADQVGYPFVVKPIDGFASRDTWLLPDRPAAAELAAGMAHGEHQLAGLFAEEFILSTGPTAPAMADYLSVEVFRAGGREPAGAFITHRPPPAWPCRETGLILPSPLRPDEQAPLIDYAQDVLDAVGARRGAYHVEIKPSPSGPETIEVNGRIGGFIARAVRYGTGQDLGRMALTSVLGQPQQVELRWDRCVLGLLFQPPAAARRVVSAPSRREVSRLPGVIAVEDIAAVGSAVHWRNGTFGMVARLWIAADSHPDLQESFVRVTEFLTDRFGYVDAEGQPVRDLSWLATVAGSAEQERRDVDERRPG
ncbi:MAG: hypothetical protein ABI140_14440 [Jatrophihabitantaceae bacterium]